MNFIDAFVTWCGESECPRDYLEWCALSLLATCCGRRIFLPYRVGNSDVKVFLNLYMLLVGPSCNYKSFAISRVLEVLNHVNHATTLNLYSGHVTHAGLYDAMRTVRRRRRKDGRLETVSMPWASQFFLVCDELANDVGSAEYADLFVRALTKLYHGAPFDDQTRTHGHIHLEGYSLNWLAGTTLEWLVLAINATSLLGGFFGRTIVVNAGYSHLSVYPYDGKRPENWDTLFRYLTARCEELLELTGPVPLSAEAIRVDRAWYLGREKMVVSDPTMQSSRRQHDLSLKLAALLALAKHDETIDDATLATAQDMTAKVVKWQREVLPAIQKGVHGSPQEALLEMVLKGVTTQHARLYKVAYDKYGIRASEMDAIVRTWLEAGLVAEQKRPRSQGGIQYVARHLQKE